MRVGGWKANRECDSRIAFMGMTIWIRGARPQTLPLGLAPVLVGVAASWRWEALGGLRSCPAFPGRLLEEHDAGDVLGYCAFSRPWFAVVAMLCAVVAVGLQIAVNYLNDYADGVRGTDARRGSDAAGPRRLVASGVDPSHVLLAAAVAALAACAAGLVAVVITGRWWLIALGATCLVAAWGYTNGRHPYGYRGLGELAAFVFFGLAPALGTQYALSGSITVTGVAGSVICGLLSVSVMMVNNLRDLEDDAAHGKRTLMVRIGSGKGKCWCMRALGWAAGLTVVFAMPLSVYAKLLDLLIKLPAEVDRDRSCTEYGICGDWSWGNADWMSLAAFVSIAGCVAIATRAVAAVRHDQWRRALPLCSMTSLVAAGAFVLNACQAGFMA